MVAIARPDDWIEDLATHLQKPTSSLYNEYCLSDSAQSELIREHRPWGYAAIMQSLQGVRQRNTDINGYQRLEAMLPELHACLR